MIWLRRIRLTLIWTGVAAVIWGAFSSEWLTGVSFREYFGANRAILGQPWWVAAVWIPIGGWLSIRKPAWQVATLGMLLSASNGAGWFVLAARDVGTRYDDIGNGFVAAIWGLTFVFIGSLLSLIDTYLQSQGKVQPVSPPLIEPQP